MLIAVKKNLKHHHNGYWVSNKDGIWQRSYTKRDNQQRQHLEKELIQQVKHHLCEFYKLSKTTWFTDLVLYCNLENRMPKTYSFITRAKRDQYLRERVSILKDFYSQNNLLYRCLSLWSLNEFPLTLTGGTCFFHPKWEREAPTRQARAPAPSTRSAALPNIPHRQAFNSITTLNRLLYFWNKKEAFTCPKLESTFRLWDVNFK